MIESPRLCMKSNPRSREDVAKADVDPLEEGTESPTKEVCQPAVLQKDDTLISSIELAGTRPQSTEPDWKPFDVAKQSMSF